MLTEFSNQIESQPGAEIKTAKILFVLTVEKYQTAISLNDKITRKFLFASVQETMLNQYERNDFQLAFCLKKF